MEKSVTAYCDGMRGIAFRNGYINIPTLKRAWR